MNLPYPDIYMNSGVFLVNQSIKNIFDYSFCQEIDVKEYGAVEENWLRIILSMNKSILFSIGPEYNQYRIGEDSKIFHAVVFKGDDKIKAIKKSIITKRDCNFL